MDTKDNDDNDENDGNDDDVARKYNKIIIYAYSLPERIRDSLKE